MSTKKYVSLAVLMVASLTGAAAQANDRYYVKGNHAYQEGYRDGYRDGRVQSWSQKYHSGRNFYRGESYRYQRPQIYNPLVGPGYIQPYAPVYTPRVNSGLTIIYRDRW